MLRPLQADRNAVDLQAAALHRCDGLLGAETERHGRGVHELEHLRRGLELLDVLRGKGARLRGSGPRVQGRSGLQGLQGLRALRLRRRCLGGRCALRHLLHRPAQPDQAGQIGSQQVGVLMACGNAQQHHAVAIIGQPKGSVRCRHAVAGGQQQGIAPLAFAHAGRALRARDGNPRTGRFRLQGLQRHRLAAELGLPGVAEMLRNLLGCAQAQCCRVPRRADVDSRCVGAGPGWRCCNAHRGHPSARWKALAVWPAARIECGSLLALRSLPTRNGDPRNEKLHARGAATWPPGARRACPRSAQRSIYRRSGKGERLRPEALRFARRRPRAVEVLHRDKVHPGQPRPRELHADYARFPKPHRRPDARAGTGTGTGCRCGTVIAPAPALERTAAADPIRRFAAPAPAART